MLFLPVLPWLRFIHIHVNIVNSPDVTPTLSDNKVNDFIAATLKWYKENGKTKERIGTCIKRVGVSKFNKEVSSAFTKD